MTGAEEIGDNSTMCGRYTLTRQDKRALAAELGVSEVDIENHMPHFNIAPTQRQFIVISQFENRKAVTATWGLVNRWARDNSSAARCINAKAQTLDSRTAFREAFIRRRCVVPADGFYEWTGPKNARQPLWIHRADGHLILFAGLYESWFPEKGKPEMTFTIVTCEPNALVSPIHDRMPVILDDRSADDWMNPREENPLSLKRLLIPAPDDALIAQHASALANSVKNDGPELLTAQ